jgi:hypothetical protein
MNTYTQTIKQKTGNKQRNKKQKTELYLAKKSHVHVTYHTNSFALAITYILWIFTN